MLSNWWLDSTIILAILAHLGIIGLILYRRAATTWPSLLTYSTFSLASQLLLYTQRPVYIRFFWIYWSTFAILAGVRLWVVADVYRAIPGSLFIPRLIRLSVLTIGFVMALGAWVAVGATARTRASHLSAAAILFARGSNIGTVALLVALIGGLAVIGMGWLRQPAFIVTGMAFRIGIGYIATTMLDVNSKQIHLAANGLNGLADVISLSLWCAAFLRTPAPKAFTTEEADAALDQIRSLPGLSKL